MQSSSRVYHPSSVPNRDLFEANYDRFGSRARNDDDIKARGPADTFPGRAGEFQFMQIKPEIFDDVKEMERDVDQLRYYHKQ